MRRSKRTLFLRPLLLIYCRHHSAVVLSSCQHPAPLEFHHDVRSNILLAFPGSSIHLFMCLILCFSRWFWVSHFHVVFFLHWFWTRTFGVSSTGLLRARCHSCHPTDNAEGQSLYVSTELYICGYCGMIAGWLCHIPSRFFAAYYKHNSWTFFFLLHIYILYCASATLQHWLHHEMTWRLLPVQLILLTLIEWQCHTYSRNKSARCLTLSNCHSKHHFVVFTASRLWTVM